MGEGECVYEYVILVPVYDIKILTFVYCYLANLMYHTQKILMRLASFTLEIYWNCQMVKILLR